MRQWRILVIKNYSIFERNYKMGNFQVKHFCLDADSYLKFTFISCGEDTEHNLLNYYYFFKGSDVVWFDFQKHVYLFFQFIHFTCTVK